MSKMLTICFACASCIACTAPPIKVQPKPEDGMDAGVTYVQVLPDKHQKADSDLDVLDVMIVTQIMLITLNSK